MISDSILKRPERHAVFWQEDGSVVLRVENTVYNVHRSILAQKSTVFKDMFALPDTPHPQGSDETNPIILEDVTCQEFDDLLEWIYKIGWRPPPVPERLLTNIMKLSNRWEIQEGQAYAILFLGQLALPPPRRLELLSRMYEINEWIQLAFEALVWMELKQLSLEDVNRIGFTTYIILAKAREAIDYRRKLIAAVPHSITFAESFRCYNHDKCKDAWRENWWRKLGKQLLHPTTPLAINGALDFLENMAHKDMTACCKADAMEELRNNAGSKFSVEEAIIAAAVEAIMTFHRSLR